MSRTDRGSGEKITAAIIGTGGIAEAHVTAIRELGEHMELVAAVDVDEERLRVFCEQHGIRGRYTDLDRMLAQEGPRLVHICTPPSSHAPLSIRSLRAGAWVFCEKPPCTTLAELDEVEAAEAETGRYCSFVFQRRFGSGAQHLRRLIEGEAFGRPLLTICHTTWFRDASYYAVPWRGRWETEAGGPTVGHGIHAIDLVLWLLGDWSEVRGMIGRVDREIETEDVSMAMVEFENGARGSFVTSVVSPREETYLRFDFQQATVELRHLYGYTDADWRFTPRPGEQEAALGDTWARTPAALPSTHTSQLRAIVDSMREGGRPPTGPREVRPTMEFIAALYRSAMTGVPVARASLTREDPFYHALHGNLAGWAPREPERSQAAG